MRTHIEMTMDLILCFAIGTGLALALIEWWT